MKVTIIPEKLGEVLKQYLSTRPHREVNQIIMALEQCSTIDLPEKTDDKE